MAAISPLKLSLPNLESSIFLHPRKRRSYPSSSTKFPNSALCRCCSRSDSPSPRENPVNRWWHSTFRRFIRNGVNTLDSYVNLYRKEQNAAAEGSGGASEGREGAEEEWDWGRWEKHFEEVDEQERLVTILQSRLGQSVFREEYKDAALLKVAIAAAAKNDTIGSVMSNLNEAVKEERYQDAAFIRDNASVGLVGWWSGISDDSDDPYGLIVHITAEHGRYIGRSFSPRQLASAAAGVPLFEIFLTVNKIGEYKQQAVYLKRSSVVLDSPTIPSGASGVANQLKPSDLTEDNTDVLVVTTEDIEDSGDTEDGYDIAPGLYGFQNIPHDIIPREMVKVSKETAPGSVDADFVSEMIEDIMDEEDEEWDIDIESEETNNESDPEKDDNESDVGDQFIEYEEEGEMAAKVAVGGLVRKIFSGISAKELVRMPAKLDKKGRSSFSFLIEKDTKQSDPAGQASMKRKGKIQGRPSMESVAFNLAKYIGKEKIPSKVLKDVRELISLTLSQAQSRQPLRGSTTFSRIVIPASSDPLNGLYVGTRGIYTSEVIHLRRRFGYWQEDGGTKDPPNLEFYEYVEALKLTGDSNVPAGEVAFRAKIGKKYQLPHKGIIPEEFGVIARYKGQGRLADPGFRNPRWVEGELVVLDGKHIEGEPAVGFIYWAPEYHFLVFFNQLRLEQ